MTTHRILRVLALALALAVPATIVGALPAYAADHFVVDNDGLTLRDTSGGTPVFTGNMESWHDGSNVRATITGTFSGVGNFDVTYVFSDNVTQTGSVTLYSGTKSVPSTSVLGKSVVRATIRYTPYADSNCPLGTWFNPGTNQCDASAPPTARTQTMYVGDSPDSHGACDQLDNDEMNLQQTGFATFFGNVTYGCTSDGHVTASVHGSLYWTSQTLGSTGRVIAVFSYSDHKDTVEVSRQFVTPTAQSATVSIGSLASNNVRAVKVTVRADDVDGPSAGNKFGDA
jgi:hypothetical protein